MRETDDWMAERGKDLMRKAERERHRERKKKEGKTEYCRLNRRTQLDRERHIV